MRDIPERDWKVLRTIKPIVIDRFCRRVLNEVASVATGEAPDAHARYLDVCNLLGKRNRTIALAFDLRRSRALEKIAVMRRNDMLTDEEFQRFSAETREFVELIVEG